MATCQAAGIRVVIITGDYPITARTVARQAGLLEHVIFGGFSHEPALLLAERLVALTPPSLMRCFLADNGSSAVEVALKMSYHY